ncbi:hypothetical protein GCM10008106_17820 [Mongoliitalea lutea]|uniref:Uncharacterized protein n=1 Tax=Mongoliitalea lutea TaxID=849756 RepID=A0A8J3G596_9BACT|nr:hypothetical protein GCM10008106_17820 [Mongoliitalea lutea]
MDSGIAAESSFKATGTLESIFIFLISVKIFKGNINVTKFKTNLRDLRRPNLLILKTNYFSEKMNLKKINDA